MRQWIIVSGFFALGLFFGLMAAKLTGKPVPDLLFQALGVATIAFIALLLYTLLQKRKG